jgi:CMP-N-acetylneuraminic acid synthetase
MRYGWFLVMNGNSEMKFVALISARGGSKGIPRKNVIDFCGKPLIQWTIDAAVESREFSQVIVSTDDKEIAELADSLNVDTSYPRPQNLSSDTSLQFDVVKYEMSLLTKSDSTVTHYVLLQPTCPLRSAEDIKNSIQIFQNSGARSLISIMDASQYHPTTLYEVTKEKQLMPLLNQSLTNSEFSPKGTLRQNFKNYVWRNGAIYIGAIADLEITDVLLNHPIAYYEMPWYRSINIDSWKNVDQAKLIHQRNIAFNECEI